MRIDIVAIGRLKSGPERELFLRYQERMQGMGRSLGLSGPQVTELSESVAKRDVDRKADEGRAILAALPEGTTVVALDENGRHYTSEVFANRIGHLRDNGMRVLSFVIGGADGLHDSVLKRADYSLCLGVMTLPHQLVRVVLAEQLYRAATILAGHPYHRV